MKSIVLLVALVQVGVAQAEWEGHLTPKAQALYEACLAGSARSASEFLQLQCVLYDIPAESAGRLTAILSLDTAPPLEDLTWADSRLASEDVSLAERVFLLAIKARVDPSLTDPMRVDAIPYGARPIEYVRGVFYARGELHFLMSVHPMLSAIGQFLQQIPRVVPDSFTGCATLPEETRALCRDALRRPFSAGEREQLARACAAAREAGNLGEYGWLSRVFYHQTGDSGYILDGLTGSDAEMAKAFETLFWLGGDEQAQAAVREAAEGVLRSDKHHLKEMVAFCLNGYPDPETTALVVRLFTDEACPMSHDVKGILLADLHARGTSEAKQAIQRYISLEGALLARAEYFLSGRGEE